MRVPKTWPGIRNSLFQTFGGQTGENLVKFRQNSMEIIFNFTQIALFLIVICDYIKLHAAKNEEKVSKDIFSQIKLYAHYKLVYVNKHNKTNKRNNITTQKNCFIRFSYQIISHVLYIVILHHKTVPNNQLQCSAMPLSTQVYSKIYRIKYKSLKPEKYSTVNSTNNHQCNLQKYILLFKLN